MTMGADVDARAALEALIEAAAPEPLPADQAVALLKRAETRDVEELGRLAYHALTGVDPGSGEPVPPAEALPGFPPFVAEVLNRAIVGPEERRPTRQALLIVLETVPAAAWPTRRPAEPAPAKPAPVESATAADPGPVQQVAEPPVETVERVETGPAGRGAEDEFRTMVAPPHDVPRFEPLSGAGELPGLDRERRRRSGRRGRRRRRRSGPMGADRRQTLAMVAAILALVALGALYAANRQPEQPVETGVPAEGAPAYDATPRLG
ncbi:hypothetical protein [Nocardioides sp. SYSU DS0651]|uniref:hypothetical protein n=1 Tax=Nocardioides sp. SYSU DS0651 TaxID=3415955 RepID=UPI003F4C4549